MDLSLHILDIAMNSITASAKFIEIVYILSPDTLAISVKDDGDGISEYKLKEICSSKFISQDENRGHGVLKLTKAVESTGGSFSIRSKQDKGTTVEAVFYKSHKNMISAGSITDTLLILFSRGLAVSFKLIDGDYSFFASTEDINIISLELNLKPMEKYLNSQLQLL